MSDKRNAFTYHLSPITHHLLHSSSFRRTAAVVRNRRRVADDRHADARVVDRANRGFASTTGTFDAHFALLHSGLLRLLRSFPRRLLCGERSAFARATKTACARRRLSH